MTIYILDEDPVKCAQMLYDKSLDKMIKDIAQVLCNVHHQYNSIASPSRDDIPLIWKDTHFEFIIWACECKANYLYLVALLDALIDEGSYRYPNKTFSKFLSTYLTIAIWLRDNVPYLPSNKCELQSCQAPVGGNPCRLEYGTPIPLVMPKKYMLKCYCCQSPTIDEDKIIGSYRNYYKAKVLIECHGCFECNDSSPISLCHGAGHILKGKFTRREIPEFLKDVL